MFVSLFQDKATSSNKMVFGNPESPVAIVTLWSKVGPLAQKVDPSHYAVMGQLFSAERGLDLLVRNLLANPQITNLVITGVDFSRSGLVLKDFFAQGVGKGTADITGRPCWRVKSAYPGYIDPDIPEDALNELRHTVAVTWMPRLDQFDPAALPPPAQRREKRVYLKKEEKGINRYVGEETGYVVRGKTIAEVWLKALDTILRFGTEGSTHYDAGQKEILNLLSVIEDEDPHRFFFAEFLPFDEQHVRDYIPQITTDRRVPDTPYTYGSRMRSWFGIDQVKEAVAKLVREPVSRAVVINLWDSTKDLTIGGSPCLNHLWLRIRNGRLSMTTTIRSNDMFEAYPDNAFGLRALQELIRQEVSAGLKEKGTPMDLTLGPLVINSQSAHIYEDCYYAAEKVVATCLPQYQKGAEFQYDARGNVVITIDRQTSEIVAEHLSPTNVLIGRYKGKSAKDLRERLVNEGIFGNPAHAFYAGMELIKAELALANGWDYVQDEPLTAGSASPAVKKNTE